jgi:hypothetical protein
MKIEFKTGTNSRSISLADADRRDFLKLVGAGAGLAERGRCVAPREGIRPSPTSPIPPTTS